MCSAGAELALTQTAHVESFTWIWDTDHYLAVYSDGPAGGQDIYAVRWTADGAQVGTPALVEATLPASVLPSIARTGAGYLVAWEEGTAPQKTVRLHALDSVGQPVGAGIDLAPSAAPEVRPVLSAGPDGLAIAWTDVQNGVSIVRMGLLDEDSLTLKRARTLGTPGVDASFPWLAGDGITVGALWSDRSSGMLDIRFAAFDDHLDTLGSAVLRSAPMDARLGRMIRTTFGYLAAWEDTRTGDNEIRMALVDTQGDAIADGLVEEPDTGDANWPNMAWSGQAAGIVYYQFRDGAPQIYMSFIDATGARVGGGADVQVSRTPKGGWARYPDVRWNGSSFGVAWLDTRSGSPQIYFAPVTCN